MTVGARAIAARLVLATAVLLPMVLLFGEALVGCCLPAYRLAFAWMAPEFRIVDLALAVEGADRVVRADVSLAQVVSLGNRVFTPDPRGNAYASTPALNALQGPLVAILTAAAWPARRRSEVVWRLLFVVPPAVAVMLLDAPCVLAAELWKILLDAADPGRTSALVVWKAFLQGGGRQAMGIAIGAFGVLAIRRADLRKSGASSGNRADAGAAGTEA